MESRLARRSAVAVAIVVVAVASTFAPAVHARPLNVFTGFTDLGEAAAARVLFLPKLPFTPKLPIGIGKFRDHQSSTTSASLHPATGDRLGATTEQPEQQLHPKEQPEQQQQQQQPEQQQQATSEKPKLETTTQDRSIITAPLKTCPDGQRMNPDRVCRPNFVDPEDD